MLSDMLSPATVDALLAAIDEPGQKKPTKERKVQTYDFKRALRFSQDHIRILTRIHENYARLMTTYSSAQLRTIIQASVHSVEQMPFEEFVKSITENSILVSLLLRPCKDRWCLKWRQSSPMRCLIACLEGRGFNRISSPI